MASTTPVPPEGLSLPITSMARLMRAPLPDTVLLHADVKSMAIKATALFIIYLADAANDIRKQTKRSTITSEDIIAALRDIDFESLIDPVSAFCQLTRMQNKEKRAAVKARKTFRQEAAEAAGSDEAAAGEGNGNGAGAGEEDGDDATDAGEATPVVKRARPATSAVSDAASGAAGAQLAMPSLEEDAQ